MFIAVDKRHDVAKQFPIVSHHPYLQPQILSCYGRLYQNTLSNVKYLGHSSASIAQVCCNLGISLLLHNDDSGVTFRNINNCILKLLTLPGEMFVFISSNQIKIILLRCLDNTSLLWKVPPPFCHSL